MSANTTRRRDWKPDFLAALEDTGMVTEACKIVGVGRRTVYDQRQKDEQFALAWADVEERSTEKMEAEARRRAVEGTEKPVFQGGVEVGRIREYSDTLLIFMLKSRRPDKYRDNVKVEHSGAVKTDLAKLTDDELQAIADGIDAKRAGAR